MGVDFCGCNGSTGVVAVVWVVFKVLREEERTTDAD